VVPLDKQHSLLIMAYIQLTLAMVIVGSIAVVGKIAITQFPVMLFSELALGLASIGMIGWHNWFKGALPKLNKVQFKYLFIQTIFGVFLFRIFFLYGLHWSSAAMAGVLISLTPVVITFLSVILLGEPITMQNALGIILCGMGIVFIQYQDVVMADNWMFLLGSGLIFLSVFCEALFTVFRKMLSNEALDPITSNIYLCTIGAVLFLPFGLYDLLNFNLLEVSFEGWLPVFYTALFVNIISFILWFRGVDRVKASTSGMFTLIMPISAIILSNIILDESITLVVLIGMTLVLAGIVFVLVPISK